MYNPDNGNILCVLLLMIGVYKPSGLI